MISPLPGATTLKPGSATFPLPGIEADIVDDAGKPVGIPGGGYLVLDAAVAVDAARHLGRSRALPRHVLEPLRRQVLRGRRRQARRRRLLLAARSRRRHHARVGPQHLAPPRSSRRSSTIPRSPRPRSSARPTTRPARRSPRSSSCAIGQRAERRARRRAARSRRRAHRPDREAEVDPVHRRAAEDALGQDHAPAPARRRARIRRSATPTTLADPAVVDGIKARYLAAATDGGVSSTPRALLPEHWTWRDGAARRPARAVVVDIDGVLSDAAGRQHYLESPRQDWRAFFDACGDDPVIEEVKTLLDLLDPELQIVLLTARPHRVHHLTEAWLRRYDIRWDLLIMRPWGDYELARDFKQSTVWELRIGRLRAAPRLRGRPPQRRDVPRRGHPVPLRPLRLLRLRRRWSCRGGWNRSRASGKRRTGGPGRTRRIRGDEADPDAPLPTGLLAAYRRSGPAGVGGKNRGGRPGRTGQRGCGPWRRHTPPGRDSMVHAEPRARAEPEHRSANHVDPEQIVTGSSSAPGA